MTLIRARALFCLSLRQREKILEQNEKRKTQLNLMLVEARGKLADHNAGRNLLEDEVSRYHRRDFPGPVT